MRTRPRYMRTHVVNLRSLLLILALLIASSTNSLAQPTPPPSSQRARLTKGDRAPFSGTLLNDTAIAAITTKYEEQIARLKLDLERLKREHATLKATSEVVCKAQVGSERAKRQACIDDKERQSKLFFNTIEKRTCPSPVWSYLSFIGGAVVAGGVCIGIDRSK